jgi:hypothetical protein
MLENLIAQISPELADKKPDDLLDFFVAIAKLTALKMHVSPIELCKAVIEDIEESLGEEHGAVSFEAWRPNIVVDDSIFEEDEP